MMTNLKGSCLCGEIGIEVPDRFSFIGNCHCTECRKWTGSAFASGGGIPGDELKITRGEDLLERYRKSAATELAFCSKCGSSLFSYKLQIGLAIVRLGILDDTPTQSPALHMYVASKAPWYSIADDLPTFEAAP